MTKRQAVKMVLEGKKPPYVPWSFGFTLEAQHKLLDYYDTTDINELENILGNHFLGLRDEISFFEDIGNGRYQDIFGVIWDRTIDKAIGIVEGCILPEPTLRGYEFPNSLKTLKRKLPVSRTDLGTFKLVFRFMKEPGRFAAWKI